MANIEEVLQRGEALSGTENSQYLAHDSLSPRSAGWVEHTGGKGLLIPEPPENSWVFQLDWLHPEVLGRYWCFFWARPVSHWLEWLSSQQDKH